MAHEPMKITNGTVGTLSKVLKEVQEVQHRELNVEERSEMQFCEGYVKSITGKFAHLADSGCVAVPQVAKKPAISKKPTHSATQNNPKTLNGATPSALNRNNGIPEAQPNKAFQRTSIPQSASSNGNSSRRPVSFPAVDTFESSSISERTNCFASSSKDKPDQKTDIQNLKRLFEQFANVTDGVGLLKKEGKPTSGAFNVPRSASSYSFTPANHALPLPVAACAYRTRGSVVASANRKVSHNQCASSLVNSRPLSTQCSNQRAVVLKRSSDPTGGTSTKLNVDDRKDTWTADDIRNGNHNQSSVEHADLVSGKTVDIETAALVKIRKAGSSWFFGAKVNQADVPPGCIPLEVGSQCCDTSAHQRNAQFERLFTLLPANGASCQSALTDTTASNPVANEQMSELVENDTDSQTHLTDLSIALDTAENSCDFVDLAISNAPPSYVDLAATLKCSLTDADSVALDKASSTVCSTPSTSAAPIIASAAPQSAYSKFIVLHSQTHKNEDDDDYFACSSDEERERKLQDAARRIQVTSVDLPLKKSAFLTDMRRKLATNSDSTSFVDRVKRISFNDAATVTHEYPSEKCWEEEYDEVDESTNNEDRNESDVLKSRFDKFFKQNAPPPLLPSYESIKTNGVTPTRLRFVDDNLPTTIRLCDDDENEAAESDDFNPVAAKQQTDENGKPDGGDLLMF